MTLTATSKERLRAEQPSSRPPTASKGMIRAGRILSALAILFLLFDAFGKFAKFAPVLQAFARLGIPSSQVFSVGVLLLISTIVYAIPRTAVLGAVVLTGYLGGAVAIQMRAESPTFETWFPVLLAIVVWAGVYLRNCGLRAVFPLHR